MRLGIAAVYFLVIEISIGMATQVVLSSDLDWTVDLSTKWDDHSQFMPESKIGYPLRFPLIVSLHSMAYFLCHDPFFLLVSDPIDWQKSWPSSYADNGSVSWWKSLRNTEGWAALQHHAVLHTTLTLYPPQSIQYASEPNLLVDLVQGSFFTVLPTQPHERRYLVSEWHAGNIYGMDPALPRAVKLPTPPDVRQPTVYDIFVSGDYEIRLFGDPLVRGGDTPVQSIRLKVTLENQRDTLVHEHPLDVAADFVDGSAFGTAFGVALRSTSGWWTVKNALVRNTKMLALTLKREVVIAPTQTRVVPLSLHQTGTFLLPNIHVMLEVSLHGGPCKTMVITLPINHHYAWNQTSDECIKATYFYSLDMPTAFLVVPPGLDWHGPSAQDAWASVDSLCTILRGNVDWEQWRIDADARVVLVGHSNGGQGAWYLASRYPDRVAGAAAYLSSETYVPWSMSRSAHYTDPALRAILSSSLTPDDNDLHLSNLVNVPILALHGSWRRQKCPDLAFQRICEHSQSPWFRERVVGVSSLLRASSDMGERSSLLEIPNEDHWFPSVFDNAEVDGFIEDLSEREHQNRVTLTDFTLTVSDPLASGSLHGWKIECLLLPGSLDRSVMRRLRLAKLRVHTDEMSGSVVRVVTSNVHSFSWDRRSDAASILHIDGSFMQIPRYDSRQRNILLLTRLDHNSKSAWRMVDEVKEFCPGYPPARLQSILLSQGPISFIVPSDSESPELSIALRLAHDLQTYHRLDSEILPQKDQPVWSDWVRTGNLVFIGGVLSVFPQALLAEKRTCFHLRGKVLELNGQALDESGTGTSIYNHFDVSMVC
ncbi:hypothetical protein H0H93_006036 [Arthromyces matolae]|nr:hypothetical protein H0H93_006036 [Arthromyces matolae]